MLSLLAQSIQVFLVSHNVTVALALLPSGALGLLWFREISQANVNSSITHRDLNLQHRCCHAHFSSEINRIDEDWESLMLHMS